MKSPEKEKKELTRRSFLKKAGAVGGMAALGTFPGFHISTSMAQSKGPIKIGFPIPLTGPFGNEAKDQEAGATLAIEEFNAKGGVLGRKVDLLVRDDKLKPDEGAKRAKELIEKDNVHFMAGGVGAHTITAINEQCKLGKTIFMNTTKSSEVTAAPDVSPYTFAEAANPHMMTSIVGPWVFKNLGKKWFFLAADYSFGWQLTDGFRRAGKNLGFVEAGLIKHPIGTTDYTSYFPKILAAEPEVLCINNFGKDQLNAVKQVHEFGLKKKLKIVFPVLLMSARLGGGDEVYEDVHGGLTFFWELEETIPSAKAFVTSYRKRFGKPPTEYAAYAYSGIKALLNGVEKAGDVEAKKVILALEGYQYDNYKGKQWFRPWDHRSMQDIFVVRSKSAKEKANEWDVFKIVQTVKADDKVERSADEMGLKENVALSSLLK
jgi:branched-chain amino acid transport system substrate-binding protein